MCAVSSLSICIPLAVDAILDTLMKQSTGLVWLRCLCLSALMSYNLMFLVAYDRDNFTDIVTTFDNSQIFCELAAVLWLLNRMDFSNSWTKPRIYFMITIYAIEHWFGFALKITSKEVALHPYLSVVDGVLLYGANAIFVLTCIQWAYLMVRKYSRNRISSFDSKHDRPPLSSNDYYCLIIVSTTVFCMVTDVAMQYSIAAIDHISDDETSNSAAYRQGEIAIRTVLTFCLCYLPSRMFKRKAFENEFEVKVKGSFVKYMSHEMRTPLSVISLGTTLE